MRTRITAGFLVICFLAAGCGSSGKGAEDGAGGAAGVAGQGGGADAGGGMGGVGAATACEADAPATHAEDPEVRGAATGTNGTFQDECTSDGDLVEYLCETTSECGPGPNPSCNDVQTGMVVPLEFDCGGACQSATCQARCPDFGDRLAYLSIDANGNAEFENQADRRRFRCTLSLDRGACKNFSPGQTTEISSLGSSGGRFCTGGTFGNIGTGDPQQCSYTDCRFTN